ncbi:MAG TPA: hypothetical protein VFH76_26275 [Kribbella sp.]|nr:hypothetical protein [Kribbella sp.]
MDELQFAAKVEGLARRTGHEPPPITRVDGQPEQECIWLEPPGPVGPMLFVHHHVNEQLPDSVQEFAIAQEFVQAANGAHVVRRRMLRWTRTIDVVVFVGVLLCTLPLLSGRGTTTSVLVYLLVGVPLAYALGKVAAVLVATVWWRRFMRRADLALGEVLGRERLLEALRW